MVTSAFSFKFPNFSKKKKFLGLFKQDLEERSLLKTSGEKEKMLVKSIFSFFQNVSFIFLKPKFNFWVECG